MKSEKRKSLRFPKFSFCRSTTRISVCPRPFKAWMRLLPINPAPPVTIHMVESVSERPLSSRCQKSRPGITAQNQTKFRNLVALILSGNERDTDFHDGSLFEVQRLRREQKAVAAVCPGVSAGGRWRHGLWPGEV